jgi:hypothetical protein
VRVLALRRPKPRSLTAEGGGAIVVNTTSQSGEEWSRGLSPFFLGPCALPGGHTAQLFENAWQFAKLYAEHADPATQAPTAAYWQWAEAGWASSVAQRFPMGRGARPLCSLWGDQRLGYIDARKRIYAPLYAEVVQRAPAFARLRALYDQAVGSGRPLVLLDVDGWDHVGQGFTLRDVIEQESPKMGHSFVLAGLLENNHFWLPST